MTDVATFEELTPEQIDAHMQDEAWGERLEDLVDRLLENSGEQDKQDAYAIISMFVQTSYMGMQHAELQNDLITTFQLAASLRRDLSDNNLSTESTKTWDDTIERIKVQMEEMSNEQ